MLPGPSPPRGWSIEVRFDDARTAPEGPATAVARRRAAVRHGYGLQPIVVFDGKGGMFAAALCPACRADGRGQPLHRRRPAGVGGRKILQVSYCVRDQEKITSSL